MTRGFEKGSRVESSLRGVQLPCGQLRCTISTEKIYRVRFFYFFMFENPGAKKYERDFLVRLRYGKVQRSDLTMLRSLLLQHSSIDFSSPPWADASLITPRHAVRTL